ncbi:hypothetical protein VDG1235_1381 [Verrucomicrobiia bacterium DG1235]|nr:hypothetical protein VDG1235_1381 [Verrucomicrobiae bacterium DG1235]
MTEPPVLSEAEGLTRAKPKKRTRPGRGLGGWASEARKTRSPEKTQKRPAPEIARGHPEESRSRLLTESNRRGET